MAKSERVSVIYRGNLADQRTTLLISTPKPSMLEGRSSPMKIYWQADGERCLASARILTPSSANYLRVCSTALYSQQQTDDDDENSFYFISDWRETHACHYRYLLPSFSQNICDKWRIQGGTRACTHSPKALRYKKTPTNL